MIASGTDSPRVKKRLTDKDIPELLELWAGELPTKQIALKINVTVAALQEFARRKKFPKRAHIKRQQATEFVDPTPEEIAERAAEIRARRTAIENERSCCYKYQDVFVMQYSYSSRTGIFSPVEHQQ
jgi:hypothetical protein